LLVKSSMREMQSPSMVQQVTSMTESSRL
jgi:pyru_phos_dikin: pyruvate, phosphate dikinase